jgi:CDP-glycerol glycerophosphotransferase (TagB/SpsB family)
MAQRTDRHPSYAGGTGQQNVAMFLNPNHWANDRWKLYYPHIPCEIVGSPKMDALSLLPKPDNPIPVVALTWHWEAIGIGNEARSAFKHYRETIGGFLGRTDIRIVGHCHPKARKMMQPWFEAKGIEFIEDLEDAFRLADVWVNDSSSTLYEAAAIGKPVVVLNAPWYRTEIKHGLRFWEGSDVGPNVWIPQQLNAAVNLALEDPPEIRERRERIAADVFPYIGTASQRAADCIRGLVEGSWQTNSPISVSA